MALLLTVIDRERRQQRRIGRSPGWRGWERQLDLVLDELDADSDVRAGARRPLALQVDVSRPASAGAGAHRWSHASASGRGYLRLRPLQLGSRERWVRSGISWQVVPNLDRRGEYDPEQAAAIAELLAVHQGAQRHGYFGAEPYLRLQSFGASLWGALDRVIAAGVELVPSEGLTDVAVSTDPVSLELDVSSADDDQTQVRLGVWCDDVWYAADAIEVLGEHGHGVALWLPGETPYSASVTLARLSRPAGPHVRRMLSSEAALVDPCAGARRSRSPTISLGCSAICRSGPPTAPSRFPSPCTRGWR